jgi:hypothetical protein
LKKQEYLGRGARELVKEIEVSRMKILDEPKIASSNFLPLKNLGSLGKGVRELRKVR